MKKHIFATIGASLLSITAFAGSSLTATAYDYDNNGVYHANAYSAGMNYSQAYLYFKEYGWGWSCESKTLYKNGSADATMYAYFNPEYIGPSYAYEVTGSPNDGLYVDGHVLSNNSCVRSSTNLTGSSNWLGIIRSSTTGWLDVYGYNNCYYLGSIYW